MFLHFDVTEIKSRLFGFVSRGWCKSSTRITSQVIPLLCKTHIQFCHCVITNSFSITRILYISFCLRQTYPKTKSFFERHLIFFFKSHFFLLFNGFFSAFAKLFFPSPSCVSFCRNTFLF